MYIYICAFIYESAVSARELYRFSNRPVDSSNINSISKHMKGSKECYLIRTKTQSSNFRGNLLYQAEKKYI